LGGYEKKQNIRADQNPEFGVVLLLILFRFESHPSMILLNPGMDCQGKNAGSAFSGRAVFAVFP
jgi:hypothetical protein